MRFLIFIPGTGRSFCGSCLRDSALAAALLERGHDVVVAPLYLPLQLEDEVSDEPVHMGGINLYLQQKMSLARHLPGALTRMLDRPGLLRWAARRGDMTDASGLGAMTVSMLRGEQGRQAHELERLCDWAATLERPDVVILANALLLGTARTLRARLDAPIACTLQGEPPFLDALAEPFREQAWAEATARAREVDAFLPVSRDHGEHMTRRLSLDPARVHPVHNGIDLTDFRDAAPAAPTQPTIGFLARLCADKGLDTLVEAFLLLVADGRFADLRLRAAGAVWPEDEAFLARLRARLDKAGVSGRVDLLPNLDRAAKLDFLRGLSVLSVPALYGESFGLYLLEAMAAGVPVVQPRHAAFPEVIEATGGGVLCEPGDPAALAAALSDLLADEPRRADLARAGREAVLAGFGAEHMAAGVEEVGRRLASKRVGA